MAPDERSEVGDIVVADVDAVQPEMTNGFLHVAGVPMHDGIEGEAEGAKMLFLPLLKRTSDFAAFAMMNAPAEPMTQFRVVELGQDAPAKRWVVNIVKNYVEYDPQEKTHICEGLRDPDRTGTPSGYHGAQADQRVGARHARSAREERAALRVAPLPPRGDARRL